MARRCPRVRAPMTRSDGVDDSGTGIMPPVHLHRGGSAQFSWSIFHRVKGRDFRGGVGVWACERMDWASARSSARLKSFPRGPGQLAAKTRGSAREGFLLSFTARGRMTTEVSGWRKQCMSTAPVKRILHTHVVHDSEPGVCRAETASAIEFVVYPQVKDRKRKRKKRPRSRLARTRK